MPDYLPQAAVAFVAFINLLTFHAFWKDKRAAIHGEWRVPEAHLLQLAFIGGTPAAFAARRLLRHKTRKQPFCTWLFVIAVTQAGLGIGLLLPMPA